MEKTGINEDIRSHLCRSWLSDKRLRLNEGDCCWDVFTWSGLPSRWSRTKIVDGGSKLEQIGRLKICCILGCLFCFEVDAFIWRCGVVNIEAKRISWERLGLSYRATKMKWKMTETTIVFTSLTSILIHLITRWSQ